jgi:hypothetical protein
MKATVYVETSVISYLTGRISRDLVVAGHQQITRDWWDTADREYDLIASDAVMREISAGDAEAVAKRVEAAKRLTVLMPNDFVRAAVAEYRGLLRLPERAQTDLLHVAFAVAYEVDYLVTWNCIHIANARTVRLIRDFNSRNGWPMPLIVTPEWMLEA